MEQDGEQPANNRTCYSAKRRDQQPARETAALPDERVTPVGHADRLLEEGAPALTSDVEPAENAADKGQRYHGYQL